MTSYSNDPNTTLQKLTTANTEFDIPNSIEDVLTYLETINCLPINTSLVSGQDSVIIMVDSYQDFMKMAKLEDFIFFTQAPSSEMDFFYLLP